MSQLKNKIQNPAVREAELRPKILSKFKNLDKENQQAILKKMEEEMSKKFKEDLKSIRSPMLFKKYQLLESGVKSSKFVSGREGTELYESELVTRANTKYRKEGNQLPVVVETVRKDVRKQSLFQQPGDQYLNIQGMESGSEEDSGKSSEEKDETQKVTLENGQNKLGEKIKIRTFDEEDEL